MLATWQFFFICVDALMGEWGDMGGLYKAALEFNQRTAGKEREDSFTLAPGLLRALKNNYCLNYLIRMATAADDNAGLAQATIHS